jgi:hypothetical protein
MYLLPKLSTINITQFVSDLNASSALRILERSLEELVDSYNMIPVQTMGSYAPAGSKEIIVRPKTQWFTDELLATKMICQQTESTMRRTKLTFHWQISKENFSNTTKLLLKCKIYYYGSKIHELGNDLKQLNRITNSLMGNTNESILPVSFHSIF